MGQCYITRRGTKTGGAVEQLGIYPVGNDGRPAGNVVVPNNVINLDNHIFRNNANVLSVALPQELRALESYCFQNCTILQEITLPNNIVVVSDYCFDGCINIGKVNLSKELSTIGQYAFQNCANLFTINIPNSCAEIGKYAFQNCSSLKDVSVEENADYILSEYAFAGCSSLTNVSAHNIMEHYSTVYSYVFRECDGLTDVKVSRFWTGMFYGCSNLLKAKSLNASNTGNQVFYNCTKLQEVYIADGSETIGTNVFYGCSALKTVYLPSSITTATNSSLTSTSSSYYAFYNCTALKDVQLGQDWDMSLRLSVSNKITVDSMVAMFNNLKDLTGSATKTLTLGSTNLAKLTDEQKAIATNKNWTLA